MLSPRWKKLWRDLQSARGRMVMMVLAIAVSIFGVGTMTSAYTILTREISRNYLGTQPASAFIELDQVDNALVDAVRAQPNIADAEATSWVTARVEVKPNEWLPLLLFVIPDFNNVRLNTFQPESGDWPPPAQTILLERAALPLTAVKVGEALSMQTPNGPKQNIMISGLAHDPGLAPAWQEQTVYGYITPATLAWLGESDTLHILKVAVKDQPANLTAIDSTVSNLAAWLKTQGRTVDEIRIPPPELHPHQSQMNSILVMLLIFSLMALGLSAILTATMINGLLAQQIRQIGIMKAIGARSNQITSLYLILVVVLGLVAVVIGVPLGVVTGQAFATVVGDLLNFTIYSYEIPAWVYIVELLMGILIPLLVALDPILRTTRTTVRETLNDYGTSREAFGSRGLDSFLGKLRGIDNTLLLAIRNTFRRRGRLLLTLGLLAAAGAMFITGLNVKTGWETYLATAAADRHYDLEIRFNSPQSEAQIRSSLSTLAGISQIEAWNLTPAAIYRPDSLDIVRTYPDGGHGSFSLRSVPPDSTLMDVAVLSGRWLQADDTNAVVLNQNAAALYPDAKVGDDINVMIDGRTTTLQLIGLVRQILTPATAYVSPERFATAAGQAAPLTNAVRIVTTQHDAKSIAAASGAIETALTAQSISMKVVISETMLEGATSGHVYIFIFALILISVVMAVVGALGLMASISTSVIERTREIGILRASGARSRDILRTGVSEG
ncbi:MAG: FtsX-like permease family protein, partial [Thermoflexales bacterium]|nr:FtsX-like permease family protein [Thermoflexales bacterium]